MTRMQLGIGEYGVVKGDDAISTAGLGSCCGVVLFDDVKKIAGMIHVMLPSYARIQNSMLNQARFADTGIPLLLEQVLAAGASRTSLKCKIAGGAKMFSFDGVQNERMMIGENNVEACRKVMRELRIPIVAEDVLGTVGRSITFFPATGKLQIKTIGRGEKEI